MKDLEAGLLNSDKAVKIIEKIHKHTDEGAFDLALKTGLEGLASYGLGFNNNPGMWRHMLVISRIRHKFSFRKIKKIPYQKKLTKMRDLDIMSLLSATAYPAMRVNRRLWQMILIKMASYAMMKGHCPESVLGYSAYGETALAYLDEDDVAEALYHICRDLLKEEVPDEGASMAAFLLGSGMAHMFDSWANTLDLLAYGADRCMNINRSLGYLCLVRACEMSFASGMPLDKVEGWLNRAREAENQFSGNGGPEMLALYSTFLKGAEQEVDLAWHENENDPFIQGYSLPVPLTAMLMKDIFDFGMDRVSEAADDLEALRREWKKLKISFVPGLVFGMEALTLTMEVINNQMYPFQAKKRLGKLKSIFEYWVKKNPDAYGHVYKVIDGCNHTLHHKFYKGEKAFEKAEALANENGSILWQAMAVKMLAHHCRYLGRNHLAAFHMQKAAELYRHWGHKVIAEHILKKEGIQIPVEEISGRWQDYGVHEASVAEKTLALTAKINDPAMAVDEAFVSVSKSYLNCESLMVFMKEGDHWVRSSDGLHLEVIDEVSKKAVHFALSHDEMVLVNKDRHHKIANYDGYLLDHGNICLMAIPLSVSGRTCGILYCERETDFTEEESKVMVRVSGHVAYLLKDQC